MEKKIQDPELGIITLRVSPRARRYSIRVRAGQVIATLPAGGSESRLLAFVEENRERLAKALREHPSRPLLDERTEIDFASFKLRIVRSERANFYMRLADGELRITCPADTCFEDEEVQATLRAMVERALRHEAKRLLPPRLSALAARHGFHYTGVRIHNSRTRWGSCSSRKGINLSLSLMRLPWHLIDYVLLHELCHTVEMNHGERFWSLLDRVTGGRARASREELRKYTIE